MLNVGILGCGRIGKVHAGSIARIDNMALRAVSDAMPKAAEALASGTGAQPMDSQELIESDLVDAVVISTPTDTHFALIHAAAQAGKAIFCEKPIDMSAENIRTCMVAVARAGVPFMTAFNRRFDPSFANLQTRLAEGEIGDPEIVTILSRDPSPPPIAYIRSSGGIFRDMMIHDIDMARFLLGEEPTRVFAVGSALVDPAIAAAGDVDTAALTLMTASGKICQISNSRRATYGYDQRIEVHGSNGMLRAANMTENSVEVAGRAGFRTAPAKHFFLERYAEAYHAEMAYFGKSVLEGQVLRPGILDGLNAQIIADAATQSAQSGEPVRLNLNSE